MGTIEVSHPTGTVGGTILLDGSKSISNRVLIIKALCEDPFCIDHLSTSDDTTTLQTLLERDGEEGTYDVGHAGTTFRFLTAYLSLQKGTQVLTGSARMLQRPIGPLVEALRSLGCKIDYLGKEGYPPLQIHQSDTIQGGTVSIDAGVSSQYLTALLLIAPSLPRGLRLKLEGDMVSESYLKLTLSVLSEFGIDSRYEGNEVVISPQSYKARDYRVEADWSAASYYFAIASLASTSSIILQGLDHKSHQGDADIVRYSQHIGVEAKREGEVWLLSRSEVREELRENFINMPDIAQTVATICAARNIHNELAGLKTLRIKETDRIQAMDVELSKIGSGFHHLRGQGDQEIYGVRPGVSFDARPPRFDTYKDHRMAMCLAPLAVLHPIQINQPEVVSKSYPSFWQDLAKLGFDIKEIA